MGQLNGDQKQRLHHVLRPNIVLGLFPEDTKAARACTVRELQIPLIDEDAPPTIAFKQQRFLPEQADTIQRISTIAGRTWQYSEVDVRVGYALRDGTKKDGTLRLCQDYRVLNNRMKTDSGGLEDMQGICQRCQGCSCFTSIYLASVFFQLPIT